MTAAAAAKKTNKPRREAPTNFRLAARAMREAQRIRRDHGDDGLADLLMALAAEVQEMTKSELSSGAMNAFTEARPAERMLAIAIRALDEIAKTQAPLGGPAREVLAAISDKAARTVTLCAGYPLPPRDKA